MSTLTGKKLDEVYHSLLKIDGNTDLSSTLQYIVDAQGNSSGIQVSTAGDMVATGDVTAAGFTGDLTGNADTATRWLNARTITIGDTGKSVDGTANVTWSKAEIGYDLQDVTDNGSTTDNSVTINSSINGELLALQLTNSYDDNNAASNPLVSMFLNAASNNGYFRVYGAPADTPSKHRVDIGSTAGGSFLTLSPNGSEKVRIDSSGNVGIGISPSYKLDVNGDVFVNGDIFGMEVIGNTFGPTEYISFYGSKLAFGTGGSDKVTINSSGDVGIGTTLPSYKLDVSGNARVTTGLFLDRVGGSPNIKGIGEGNIVIDSGGGSGDLLYLNAYVLDDVILAYGGGNVGINYSTPASKLVVKSNAQTLELRGDNHTYIGFYRDNATRSGYFGHPTGSNSSMTLMNETNDALYLGTNSSTAITILPNTNVGIGTTSPAYGLDVYRSTSNVVARFESGDQDVWIDLHDNTSGTYGVLLGARGSDFRIAPNNNDAVWVKSTGEVGIGTTSPSARIHAFSAGTNNVQEIVAVLGSTSTRPVLQFSESTAGTINAGMSLEYNGQGSGDSNYMVINSVANVPRFTVMSGGNVGIGTTSPSEKLTVAGDITNDGDSRGIYWTGGTTSAQNRIVIGEQNNYGVGFRWDSGSSLQFDGFWATNVKGAANRTLGSIDVNNRIWYLYDSLVTNTLTVSNGVINMNNNDGFVYDDGANVMKVKYDGTEYNIWTQANDGSGSGLDADLLDGSQGTYYDHRRYTDASNYLGGYYVSGGLEKPNSSVFGAGKLKIAMLRGGSTNLGFGGTWNDVLWMSTYNGGDVKRSTALVSSKYDNTSLWIAKQNYDSSSWGTGYLIWNSGNDGSGSGLDADLLDGLQASQFLRSDATDSTSGSLTVGGNLTLGSVLIHTASQSRDKLRVWSSGTYSIGMDYRYTYGHLNDYAMTFQMSNTAARGWWWGDSSHSDAQGAMSLTTEGKLVVATSVSIGQGESITAPDSSRLFVQGVAYAPAGIIQTPTYGSGITFKHTGAFNVNAASFVYGTNSVGYIQFNSSGTTYSTSSDYRLKENIVSLSDGIDRLKLLKPSRFNFIGNTEVVDGFIAHEAQEVVPQAVTGEKDAVGFDGEPIYQGIDQSKLIPLLTAALQEAVAKIEALEQRITILENN